MVCLRDETGALSKTKQETARTTRNSLNKYSIKNVHKGAKR